ncbi:hypothetical protein QW180_26405 [Vibrio sinaloensis]|nr:hypothetical protein [Vibrio sinaloensis]
MSMGMSSENYSIEKKLEKLDTEISLLNNASETHASVALFFGGEPVLGSKGILASFAGNVLDNFQELINKAFASKEKWKSW